MRTATNWHLQHLPRRVDGPPPLAVVGDVPRKRSRVVHTFDTFNVSCLLAGSGTYRWRGELLTVTAPAVITQVPGVAMDYGPQDWWHEVYLIYPPEALEHFRTARLIDPERPLWNVGAAARYLAAAEDLVQMLMEDAAPERLDRQGELLVAESVLAAAEPPRLPAERLILELREAIDEDPRCAVDPEREALAKGLSRTHFRRLWQRLVGVPPARYAAETALREAARRLTAGDAPVAQVARDTGFADPLYFSRRFRAWAGMSPAAYRRCYRDQIR